MSKIKASQARFYAVIGVVLLVLAALSYFTKFLFPYFVQEHVFGTTSFMAVLGGLSLIQALFAHVLFKKTVLGWQQQFWAVITTSTARAGASSPA